MSDSPRDEDAWVAAALAGAPRLLPDLDLGRVVMRPRPEDFIVEEVPLFEPSGQGTHLFLFVEKRGATTPDLSQALKARYGVKDRDIGLAGRKDKHGITRQWVSIPAQAAPDEGAGLAEDARFTVLRAARHEKKLRMGFLRANRFTVGLEAEAPLDAHTIDQRAAALAHTGLPNGFGAQRFGPDGRTVRQALRFIRRPKRARTKREGFWVSALQSVVFNRWLRARLDDELFSTVLEGDVMARRGGRATFFCDDPAADQPRLDAAEVAITGPMPGAEMRPARGAALTWESRSADGLAEDIKDLMAHPAFDTGARRPIQIWPEALSVQVEGPRATLSFALPKGAYATVFLREVFGAGLVDGADLARAAGSDSSDV